MHRSNSINKINFPGKRGNKKQSSIVRTQHWNCIKEKNTIRHPVNRGKAIIMIKHLIHAEEICTKQP
jgi:hypothetical protein